MEGFDLSGVFENEDGGTDGGTDGGDGWRVEVQPSGGAEHADLSQ